MTDTHAYVQIAALEAALLDAQKGLVKATIRIGMLTRERDDLRRELALQQRLNAMPRSWRDFYWACIRLTDVREAQKAPLNAEKAPSVPEDGGGLVRSFGASSNSGRGEEPGSHGKNAQNSAEFNPLG